MYKRLLLLLFVLASAPAFALGPRVEWGVIAGINVPGYSTSDDYASVKNRMGWQAGIVSAVRLGAWSVEPQILYVRQGLNIAEAAESVQLRAQSLDVPLLVSCRVLHLFRLYAGPVFTVLNSVKERETAPEFDFGQVRTTVSYALGANVKLLGHLLVDLRYNGQFRNKHDIVLPTGSRLDNLSTYNVALSVGYIF